MNTVEKLEVLGASSKWDTCGPGMKKPDLPGVYRAKTPQGECRLMKVLYTNQCVHDCRYCINSSSCKKASVSFEPVELAGAFQSYLKQGLVDGLFLSSAVSGDPDAVADDMIRTAGIIRVKHRFQGYMHLKVLPGVSKDRISQLAELSNRVSLNLEAPAKSIFSELSTTKQFGSDLMRRLSWMKEHQPSAGITTQFVVGAAGETDAQLVSGMDRLFRKFSLRRIYFSAFDPIEGTPLAGAPAAPARREFRLYQSEWLLRVYRFDPIELHSILDDQGFLPLDRDPKLSIALNHPDEFPVDINMAGEEELVRVPGIGPRTARRVVEKREAGLEFKRFPDLLKAGVSRTAFPFLEVSGAVQSRLSSFFTAG